MRPPSLGCFVTAAIQKVHRSAQQMLATSRLYLVLDPEQVSESQELFCGVGEMAQ